MHTEKEKAHFLRFLDKCFLNIKPVWYKHYVRLLSPKVPYLLWFVFHHLSSTFIQLRHQLLHNNLFSYWLVVHYHLQVNKNSVGQKKLLTAQSVTVSSYYQQFIFNITTMQTRPLFTTSGFLKSKTERQTVHKHKCVWIQVNVT